MAQIRKLQPGGSAPSNTPKYKTINLEGLGDFDPEDIRTLFAQDPDSWFKQTGADPKYRDQIIARFGEILDMSKQHGMKGNMSGTYTFDSPDNVNKKYSSDGQFHKKGIFGIRGTDMNENAINNLAYYMLDKIARGGNKSTTTLTTSTRGGITPESQAIIDNLTSTAQNNATEARKNPYKGLTAEILNDRLLNGNNLAAYNKRYGTDSASRFNNLRSILDTEITSLSNPNWEQTNRWTGSGTRQQHLDTLKKLRAGLSGDDWSDSIYNTLYDTGYSVLEPFLNPEYSGTGTTTDNIYNYQSKNRPNWVTDDLLTSYNMARMLDNNVRLELRDGEARLYDGSGNPYTKRTFYNYLLSPYSAQQGSYFHNGKRYLYNKENPQWENDLTEQDRYNIDLEFTPIQIGGNKDYAYDSTKFTLKDLDKVIKTLGNNPKGYLYFGDFTGLMSGLSSGSKLIGLYDSNRKTGLPDEYALVTDEGVKIGTLSQSSSGSINFNDGTNITDLGLFNREGSIKTFSGDANNYTAKVSFDNAPRTQETIDNIRESLKTNKLSNEDTADFYRNFKGMLETEGNGPLNEGYMEFDGRSRHDYTAYGSTWDVLGNYGHTKIKIKDGNFVTDKKGNRIGNKQSGWFLVKYDVPGRIFGAGDFLVWVNVNTGEYLPVSSKHREDGAILAFEDGGILYAQKGEKLSDERRAELYGNKKVDNSGLNYSKTKPGQVFDTKEELEYYDKTHVDPEHRRSFQQMEDRGEWSDKEKLEMGLVLADLGSAVSSFVPGAHFIGTGVGITSSLGQFGLEVADHGFTLKNLGNLGMNLGLDALSLIPGAKLAKTAKTLLKLVKFMPKAMKIYGTSALTMSAMAGPMKETYDKAMKFGRGEIGIKDFNTQDLLNILQLFRLAGNQTQKASQMKRPDLLGKKSKYGVQITDKEGKTHTIEIGNKEQLHSFRQNSAAQLKEIITNKAKALGLEDIIVPDASKITTTGQIIPSVGLKGHIPVEKTASNPNNAYMFNNRYMKAMRTGLENPKGFFPNKSYSDLRRLVESRNRRGNPPQRESRGEILPSDDLIIIPPGRFTNSVQPNYELIFRSKTPQIPSLASFFSRNSSFNIPLPKALMSPGLTSGRNYKPIKMLPSILPSSGNIIPLLQSYNNLPALLSYNKKGGVLKYQKPAGPLTNITGNNIQENWWWDNIGKNTYDQVLNDLSNKKYDYNWINSQQSSHYNNIYKPYSTNPTTVSYNSKVLDYQNMYKNNFNTNNQNVLWTDIVNPYTKRSANANSLDRADNDQNVDGLAGQLTDWRRILGRKGDLTDQQFSEYNNKFKNQGLELYLDNADSYYKLKPFLDPGRLNLPSDSSREDIEKELGKKPDLGLDRETQLQILGYSPEKAKAIIAKQVAQDKGSAAGLGDKDKDKNKDENEKLWNPIPLLRGMRAWTGIHYNDKQRAPLRSMKDPLDLYTFVTGDLTAKNFAQNQAAKFTRSASRPFTSDAQLQLAGQLDAQLKANDILAQGNMADAKVIKETGYRAVERQHENLRNRNQIANLNKDIFDSNQAAKILLDNLKNYYKGSIYQGLLQAAESDATLAQNAIRNAQLQSDREKNAIDYQRLLQVGDNRLRILELDSLKLDNSILDHDNEITSVLNNTSLTEAQRTEKLNKLRADKLLLQNNKRDIYTDLYGDYDNTGKLFDLNAKAAENLRTANLKSMQKTALDSRWAPRNGPWGYFGYRAKGGTLNYNERAALQNAQEANINDRTLARNLNKKAISDSDNNAKMIRELARTFRLALKGNYKAPKLK